MTEIVKEIATVINRPYKLPTPSAGPEYVQFVVVAGRADELKSIRANVDPYGDECWQWRPYYPEFEKSVGPFVQGVVASENLASGWLQPTASLPEELERAKGKNIVVVVIVDVWTIRLSSYHELMRKFDKRSFFNCAVLIPWNSQDGETEQNHDKLETALRVTFENKMASKDPRSFREGITSPEELDSELRDVLIEIRRRILETGEVFRKAVGESVIVQPQINGPGGVEPL
jgi:FxsC-like protein